MPPVIDRNKCTVCGVCAEICGMDILKKIDDRIVVRYPNECWHCRACAIDCPTGAIRLRYPLSHMMLHIPAPNRKGGTAL